MFGWRLKFNATHAFDMSSRASTITVYITSSHVYALNMMSIISSDACHHSIQFSIGMYMDAVDSEHFAKLRIILIRPIQTAGLSITFIFMRYRSFFYCLLVSNFCLL